MANVTVDNTRAALARRLQTKVLIERPNQRIGRIQSAASLGHKRKRNRRFRAQSTLQIASG